MATDYFSDNEAIIMSQPLSSPAGTPYNSGSRRTSRFGTPASDMASPPPALPSDPYMSTDDANDESISVLDPRRFTPTLHANLVSEILNLRRELDSKHKFIEELEIGLHASKDSNEVLAKQLSAATKETRGAKRQLQTYENETIAALEEIAGERDRLKTVNAELRERLEVAQKKTRNQDDESNRVHDMWAREKEAWAGEKRLLERRVHTSEARLNTILEEIASHEAAREEAGLESEGDDLPTAMPPESDTASIQSSPQRRPSTRLGRHSRNRSNSSYRSIGRNYRMSLMSTDGFGRGNGLSLADELIFDEEEEDLGDLELDSDDFPENEMRARRALESRQSLYPDEKAKRILGLSNDPQQLSRDDPTPVEDTAAPKTSYETVQSSMTLTPRDITLVFPPTRPIYVDTGVQPSPPPSPKLPSMVESSVQTEEVPAQSKLSETSSVSADIEANQRRKRVSAPWESPNPSSANITHSLMISSSVQTVEQPLSPPDTPKISIPSAPLPISPIFKVEVTSTATQTEAPEEEEKILRIESNRSAPPASILIPSIAIHAPSSAPSSPKEPILPPGTKTVSTQTTGDLAATMRSYGMQTEPIRIDKRAVKLPAHLLPSAISSKPSTPEPAEKQSPADSSSKNDSQQVIPNDTEQPTARPKARQDLTATLEKAAGQKVENRYPGNNDNGPLAKYQAEILNRPFRTSSLFAGFDGPSSDEDEDDEDDAEFSDDDFRSHQFSTSMLSSRNAKSGRPVKPPTPVPEDVEAVPSRLSEESMSSSVMGPKRNSLEKPAKVGKPVRTSLTRQPSIRKSAMIHSGTAAHARSRSPSIGSLGSSNYVPKPPFPVPMRSSSRNKPVSKSEGSQSPTPRNSGPGGRRPYGVKHQRKDSLRKVRSAAPVSKPSRSRSRSPTLPATPSARDSMSIPPLPSDVVSATGFGHRHQLSSNTVYTANGSVNTSASQTSVVDAIAASMIGEFMWKYVRKRKTFGGPDSPADRAAEEAALASHGVRHKRWVWISPYERAILWSSKQPTSGSALMGKSGRKRKFHESSMDYGINI